MPSIQSLLVLTASLIAPIVSLAVPLEARTLEARVPPVSYFPFLNWCQEFQPFILRLQLELSAARFLPNQKTLFT